jgi:hypothetical protein
MLIGWEEYNYFINIILVNLLDSDWLKTVPIKH